MQGAHAFLRLKGWHVSRLVRLLMQVVSIVLYCEAGLCCRVCPSTSQVSQLTGSESRMTVHAMS